MPSEMLKCCDCGNNFEWSEKDQKFYRSKGYEPPKRCRSCRDKRKKRFADNKKRGNRARRRQDSHDPSCEPARSGSRR
jgi:hypothetical protein